MHNTLHSKVVEEQNFSEDSTCDSKSEDEFELKLTALDDEEQNIVKDSTCDSEEESEFELKLTASEEDNLTRELNSFQQATS